MTWRMRYRFRLSTKMAVDGDSLELSFGERSVTLKARMGGPLQDTQDFVLIGGGFPTEAEARTFGESLRHALLAASAYARIGVDIGEDKPTTTSAAHVKAHVLEQTGAALLDDVHGLMVYPEDPPPHVLSVQGRGTVRMSPETFLSAVRTAFDANVPVPTDLEVPIELYCASAMEPSPVAQLILAVSTIEAIAGRPQRPPGELQLVEIARAAIKQASVIPDERDSVLDSLNLLQTQSVRRAGRQIVEEHLPGEGAAFIEVYDYRGRIAHSHSRPDRAELANMATRARLLAGKLIAKLLGS